jgi:hypothetical protein
VGLQFLSVLTEAAVVKEGSSGHARPQAAPTGLLHGDRFQMAGADACGHPAAPHHDQVWVEIADEPGVRDPVLTAASDDHEGVTFSDDAKSRRVHIRAG